MNLISKLLRRHTSISQLIGFALANLAGMWIVMLGIQFYYDAIPLFTSDDAFSNSNFIVVSKHISDVGTAAGKTGSFNETDIDEIKDQAFCKRVAAFTSSAYKTTADMSFEGISPITTEIFFESVPDNFVDANPENWQYKAGETDVPVILPRTYIALYNFGFAQSRGLPKLSDGLAGSIKMTIRIRTSEGEKTFQGHIQGFSGKLNSILVPQSFMEWSNNAFAPEEENMPERLIVEVINPTDDAIVTFMQEKGYDVEDNKLDAGRATYFLKVVVSIVMLVGLLVCILSFFILSLSIFLLIQKNTTKLETLLLIGYSPDAVSRPYQIMALGTNLITLLVSFGLVMVCRMYYTSFISVLFPQMESQSILPAIVAGLGIFVFAAILNTFIIRKKINDISNHK